MGFAEGEKEDIGTGAHLVLNICFLLCSAR